MDGQVTDLVEKLDRAFQNLHAIRCVRGATTVITSRDLALVAARVVEEECKPSALDGLAEDGSMGLFL
jgi:hypothetical protein